MIRVSVVMPMYNAAPYVGEAIESIINQTFQDWELLVIDDGSSDSSPELVRGYAAKNTRIKLLSNNSGAKGEGPARNVGIDNASGEYVAMMDADDISLPNRLELQAAFMDKHPDVALSGCWAQCFGTRNGIHWSPSSNWVIKAVLCFFCEPWGPTIIFRRAVIQERYAQITIGEDTLFTTKICLRHPVANIPKVLYRYRVHSDSITRTTKRSYLYRKKVWEELLPLRLGFMPTDEQINAHLGWQGYTLDADNSGHKISNQMKWVAYAIIHGNYKWYERCVLSICCVLRFLRNMPFICILYEKYKTLRGNS